MDIGVKKRTYLVDLMFAVTREVDAETPEAAEKAAELQLNLDRLGVPDANDLTEVRCVGRVRQDADGNTHWEYFS